MSINKGVKVRGLYKQHNDYQNETSVGGAVATTGTVIIFFFKLKFLQGMIPTKNLKTIQKIKFLSV